MSVNAEPDANRLARILSRQFDVIARRQASACGITRSALRHKLRAGGPWRKILPGVYLAVTGTVTPEQREMAALLYAGPRGVITGAAAVRRHRLDCPGLNEVDILVPVGVRRQSAGYVRIQHTSRMPESAWATRSIRFAPLARAVADAARGMKRFSDVRAVVCEAVQRGGCTLDELIAELQAGRKITRQRWRVTTGWKPPEFTCFTSCPALSGVIGAPSLAPFATRLRRVAGIRNCPSWPSRQKSVTTRRT